MFSWKDGFGGSSSIGVFTVCLSNFWENVGQLPFDKTRHKQKPGCVSNTIFIFLNLNICLQLFLFFIFFSKKICFVYITCYEEFELNKSIKIKLKKKLYVFIFVHENIFGCSLAAPQIFTDNLFIPTLDTTTEFVIMTIWLSQNLQRWKLVTNYARILCLIL